MPTLVGVHPFNTNTVGLPSRIHPHHYQLAMAPPTSGGQQVVAVVAIDPPHPMSTSMGDASITLMYGLHPQVDLFPLRWLCTTTTTNSSRDTTLVIKEAMLQPTPLHNPIPSMLRGV